MEFVIYNLHAASGLFVIQASVSSVRQFRTRFEVALRTYPIRLTGRNDCSVSAGDIHIAFFTVQRRRIDG
ncbi:hypothetical protein D3C75_1295100 [compost metagenome]